MSVRNQSKPKDLAEVLARDEALDFLKSMNRAERKKCMAHMPHSRSQIFQDLFVLNWLNYKRSGYFVEFGAADGVIYSNSHLLEKELGWSGILAEPARVWRADLERNRTAHIDTRCVWKSTGETLVFNEVALGELSTIDDFSDHDSHSKSRETGSRYEVSTVSLNDLLETHDAPDVIDYLSIDTEGSELEILSALDFERYKFRVITCEHNFTPARRDIHWLLVVNGYHRICVDQSRFEDWYVSGL